MSNPLRIPCHSVDSIPPISRIRQLVTDDQHVVLKFMFTVEGKPVAVEKQLIIQRLALQLPDFTVFDSGGKAGESTWVTIKKVIAEQDVLSHAEEIVAAMRQFRTTAGDLMRRLARQLEVPPEAFSDRYFRLRYTRSVELAGKLDERVDESREEPRVGLFHRLLASILAVFERQSAEWEYRFHGGECQFRNAQTGQMLEIRLGFQDEFGVLDPYFFFQFVSTTPGLEEVAGLFKDGFHDSLRALEILERLGYLTRISSQSGDRAGLVAPDP